jgi:hypothetical protein
MSNSSQLKKLFYFSFFRNSKAVSFGIAIVVLVVGGLWVLYPKYDSIRSNGILSYDSKKLALQNRNEHLSQINNMLKLYHELDKNDVDTANLVLPGESQIPELFVMMDQLGRDMDLRVSRIAFSGQGQTVATASPGIATTPATGGQLKRLGITLGLDYGDGISYGRFKEILSTLEQNIRIMDLNNVSYDASQQAITLNLNTYYLHH